MSMSGWQITVNVELPAWRAGGSDPAAAAVAEMFGLPGEGDTVRLYQDFRLSVAPGEIVLVVGPSGAGKSCLLRAIASAVPEAVLLDGRAVAGDDRPAVACLDDGASWQRMLGRLCGCQTGADGAPELSERLELLSRCGLAEAAALLTPAGRLSGGQAYRLALASAVWRALRSRGRRLVLADEFAAVLDDATAAVLAAQTRKLVHRYRLAMVLATPRAELAEALAPARTVIKPLGGPPAIVRGWPRTGSVPARRWRVTRGTIADYHDLGRFHYLAGPPAAHKRVWTVRVPRRGLTAGEPDVAAVLVVSPPVLRCRGRNVATAGRYAGSDRRAATARLNAEIECISRVVVHPIYRGCGLAVRLVRRALAEAQTPFVEALAAMGAVHPFFELAGMTCHGRFGSGRGYSYYLARPRH